jgi:hypothetical protein
MSRPDEFNDERSTRSRRFDDDFERRPPPPRKSNLGLILGIVLGVLFLVCAGGGVAVYYLMRGAVSKVGEAAERMHSSQNLMQIGHAIHAYHDDKGMLPANTYGPDGKPLLSWRVHILPYIGEDALYKQFKLDEPWDSPANRPLMQQMPRVYARPAEVMGKAPMGSATYYRGFSSAGGVFARRDGGKGKPVPMSIAEIQVQDGSSRTILVVEAGDPVEWTKPDDLDAAPGKPFPTLGGARPESNVVMVLFADGAVKAVVKTTPEAKWRASVTYNGGEADTLD